MKIDQLERVVKEILAKNPDINQNSQNQNNSGAPREIQLMVRAMLDQERLNVDRTTGDLR